MNRQEQAAQQVIMAPIGSPELDDAREPTPAPLVGPEFIE